MMAGASRITAAIVHCNMAWLDRAVRQLRAQGTTVADDLLAHVAQIGGEHIGLTGDYVWTAPDPAAPRGSRYVPASRGMAHDFEQIA